MRKCPARRQQSAANAQRQSPPPPHIYNGDLHDPKPRPRTPSGDRHTNRIGYWIAVVDAVRAKRTTLRVLFQTFKKELPGWMAWLEHFYDHRLLATLHRFEKLSRAITTQHNQGNAYVASINAQITTAQEKLRQECASATKVDRAERPMLEQKQMEAQMEAASAMAVAGVVHTPKDPTGNALYPQRRSLESLAGENPDQAAHGVLPPDQPPWLDWLQTLGIGSLIGIGVGLMNGGLDARYLDTTGPADLAWGLAGILVTTVNKAALGVVWGEYAAATFLPTSSSHKRTTLGLALCIAVVLLAADVAVQQQGLLAGRRAQHRLESTALVRRDASLAPKEAGANPDDDLMVRLAAPLLISTGYITYFSSLGFSHTRFRLARIVLLARQEQDLTTRDRQRRNDSAVKQALAALSTVQVIQWRLDHLTTRINQTEAAYKERIEALEQQRLQVSMDLSDEEKDRIQDAHDEVIGAEYDFDRLALTILSRSEPLGARADKTLLPEPKQQPAWLCLLLGIALLAVWLLCRDYLR